MYRAAQTTIPREVDEPWITGLAIGHIARIVAGEFTNYKRTTFKARFECLGESFQLQRAASFDAGRPPPIAPQSRTRRRWTV